MAHDADTAGATPVPQLYEPAGFFMLRAPMLDVSWFERMSRSGAPPEVPPVSPVPPVSDPARSVVDEALLDPRFRVAVAIASESVAHAADKLTRVGGPGTGLDEKGARRTYATLERYLGRMATRPTPYGLFAGVAVGQLAARTDLRLADSAVGTTRTRADIAWVLNLIKDIESGPAADRLTVQLNSLVYRAGDRLILPYADVHGVSDNRRIDIGITPVLEVVMALSTQGLSRQELTVRLAAEVEGAGIDQARGLVNQLWDLHVLLSDLRPSMGVRRPEVELREKIQGIDELRDVHAGLTSCIAAADAADDAAVTGSHAVRWLQESYRSLTPGYVESTFQLDTQLATTGNELAEGVAVEAARAAELLQRLGRSPARRGPIADYHQAFIERYGLQSEIQLLEVLSPELGLDAPNHYTSPRRSVLMQSAGEDPGASHAYDQALAAMLLETLAEGTNHLELDDERLGRLLKARPVPTVASRPTLDLYVQVAATSTAAIDRGDYLLVIAPACMSDGGRTFGRFSDMLGPETVENLRRLAKTEQQLHPDVVLVELNYTSPHGRASNVSPHASIHDHEINVNASATGEAAVVPLEEIVVGALADRLYLRWGRTGQELRVVQSHMLNIEGAPNLCRFLIEVSDDGYRDINSFDWGSMTGAPHLPRVARGRLVLQPEQWNVPLSLLPDPAAAPETFQAEVERWRLLHGVPARVYATSEDNRLPLQLDSPRGVAELRAELRRVSTGHREAALLLQEMLPSTEDAWLLSGQGPHMSELVVPLVATDARACARSRVPRMNGATASRLSAEAGNARRRVPGEDWTYVKVYAHPVRQDDILSGPLVEHLAGLEADGLLQRWYFLRYADPHPHLRLRFLPAQDADAWALLRRTLSWGAGLVRANLAADVANVSYDREVERYGGPEAIDAAEEVFDASSRVAVELAGARGAGRLQVAEDVAAAYGLHRLHRAWGADTDGSPPTPDEAARTRFRAVRRTLCDLIEPWDAHPDEAARVDLPELAAAYHLQDAALNGYRTLVHQLEADDRLVGTPVDIFASVAHMQVNRVLGLDNDAELLAISLHLQALAAIAHRPMT